MIMRNRREIEIEGIGLLKPGSNHYAIIHGGAFIELRHTEYICGL